MAGKVIDSYGLLTYLEGARGSGEFSQLLKRARDNDRNLMVSAVSWSEAVSVALRELGPQRSAEIERVLETLPITVVPVDQTIARQAAAYRAEKDLPYATCFAAALAKIKRAELVTGDERLRQLNGELRIKWLSGQGHNTGAK